MSVAKVEEAVRSAIEAARDFGLRIRPLSTFRRDDRNRVVECCAIGAVLWSHGAIGGPDYTRAGRFLGISGDAATAIAFGFDNGTGCGTRPDLAHWYELGQRLGNDYWGAKSS